MNENTWVEYPHNKPECNGEYICYWEQRYQSDGRVYNKGYCIFYYFSDADRWTYPGMHSHTGTNSVKYYAEIPELPSEEDNQEK